MKSSLSVIFSSFVLLSAFKLFAAESSPSQDDDFKIIEQSVVSGEFKGCTPQVGIPIGNKLFICTTFGFSPAIYSPAVTVLKNKNGEYKVLINGTIYIGYFKED
jgi:hypothetical protein